jgi:hypothetical protein
MPQNNGRGKGSEKGLLTPDNCVVAFIDHQPQMLFGTSSFDRLSTQKPWSMGRRPPNFQSTSRKSRHFIGKRRGI